MPKLPNQPEGSASIATPKIRRGIRAYFAEVGREMRKVSWPPHTETTRLTGVVLAVCGLVVLLLVTFNYVFDFLVTGLRKGF
jgi:preprotein translocase SecE subunit